MQGGTGLIPGRGAKIPHASLPKNQNIKQKQYCNKFNKDFKNGPHQKKNLKKKSEHNWIKIFSLNCPFPPPPSHFILIFKPREKSREYWDFPGGAVVKNPPARGLPWWRSG